MHTELILMTLCGGDGANPIEAMHRSLGAAAAPLAFDFREPACAKIEGPKPSCLRLGLGGIW